jgi:hypothetical protein
VTDSISPVDVTENGSHANGVSPAVPEGDGRRALVSRSVEERLDALRDTVRTWDWHEVSVPPRPAGPDADAQTQVPALSTPPVDAPAPQAPPVHAPAAPTPSLGNGVATERVDDPTDDPITIVAASDVLAHGNAPLSSSVADPLVPVSEGAIPPTSHAATHQSAPSPPATPPPVAPQSAIPPPLTPLPLAALPEFGPGGPDVPGPPDGASRHENPGASRRERTRHRIKVGAVVLLAILAVGGIVEGIRLATKNSGGSNGPSATQTTVTQHHVQKQAPVDAAKLTRYEGYAVGLQRANEAATRGFVAAGSTPSAAQVAGIVTAYRSALNLYDFQLHFIAWPAAMQTAIATDHAQFQALMSFLQSYPNISPTGVSAWLTQLHNRTGSTAAADNVVRNDLGLSNSSAWP